MELEEALVHWNSVEEFAKAMKVSPQAVYGWARNGIPKGRQFEIIHYAIPKKIELDEKIKALKEKLDEKYRV